MRSRALATRVVKNANSVWRRFGWVLAAVLLLTPLSGCREGEPKAETRAAPKTVADWFEIKVGPKTVRMQLAVREPEMMRGLMERRDLGADEGMLFVYAKPQQMSFWMRNTPTPLDIGFFNRHGMLEEIYPLHPYDETPVRSRSTLMQFALEMNQGWYRANGVRPGMEMDMAALKRALKERGFEARDFGIE